MKKILCLVAIAILVVSCGKKSAESYYIPKDAIGVMYVNLESLSKKSDAINFSDLRVNEIIEKQAPKELKEFMDTHMTSEKMNATFRKEFIHGFISIKRMSGFGGFVLPIKNAAAFEEFIQPMVEKSRGLEKEENVGKNNAFTVYSNKSFAVGWNDKTALIIIAPKYPGAELIDLTELEKSESVSDTKYYSKFFDPSKDMGMHITSTPLGTVINSLLTMTAGWDIELENNTMSHYASFEDDHIYTSSKLSLNKDLQSIIGYKSWMATGYDSSLLDVIPNDPAFLAKLSLNPSAVYDHLQSLQNNKSLPMDVRMEMKEGMKKSNREFEKNLGMPLKEAAGIFEGSMLFSMTEGKVVKDTVYSYSYYDDEKSYEVVDKKVPNIYAAIALKDRAKFDQLLNHIKTSGAPMEEKGKDYYSFEGSDSNMIITDNVVFITNDVAKAEEVHKNGRLSDNLSDFKHKSNLSHSGYLYAKGNMSNLTTSFAQSLTAYTNPYSRYSGVGGIGQLSEKSNEIYNTYFGENHYFIDADGSESFSYTKGDQNSLIQVILYSDALAKEYAETKGNY